MKDKKTHVWKIAYQELTVGELIRLLGYLVTEDDIQDDSLVEFHHDFLVIKRADGENVILEENRDGL